MTSVDHHGHSAAAAAAALRSEQAALEYELAQVQRELAAARVEAQYQYPHHQQQPHATQPQPHNPLQPQLQPQQLSRQVAVTTTGRPSSSSRPTTAAALLNGTNLTRAAHQEFLKITARAQSAALRRYFDAVNGHDDFEQRRQERLANAAPFSFEMREMTKPKSRALERAEQERLERERAEEEMLNTRFKARPVPASTFEPRYAAMVDEAAAHREAVRVVAQERGMQLVQAEEQRKEFTAVMRDAQNELQPRRAKRNMTPDEAFAEWQRTHCQQFRANPVPPTTYATENRLQTDRDATREMRVKARAEAMLQTARAPPRMEEAAANASTNNAASTSRGLVSRDAFVADLAAKRPMSAVERKRQEREALRERNPNFTFAPQISGDPPAFEAQWARERLARAVVKQKYRNLQRQTESTARDLGASDGDGGFTSLRAHSAMAVAQREMRLRRAQEAFVRATDGQVPPDLLLKQQLGAADAADPIKAAVILEAAVDDLTRRRETGEAVAGAPVMRSVVGVGVRSASTSAAAPLAATDSRPCQVPRTTHAHVLRSASTYKHIVSRAEEAERKAREDEDRRKRQEAANQRLRAMGVPPSAAKAPAQVKTRALLFAGPGAEAASAPSAAPVSAGGVDWEARAAQKRREVEEATRAAKAQLDAMKERVRSQPPVFVAEAQAEATLESLTKARAETEARVMAAWRSSGLTPVDVQAALRAGAAGGDDAISGEAGAAPSKARGGIEAKPAAVAGGSDTYSGGNYNGIENNHAFQPASATADTRPASPAPVAAVTVAAPAPAVGVATVPIAARSFSRSSSSSSSSSSFASSSSND